MTIKGDSFLDMNDEMEDQFVLVEGNVPQLLEYQQDKILLVVGQALKLYEKWQHIKTIEINLPDNFFTMVRKGSVRPYGYMGLLPKFGEIPLILVSGS